MATLAQLRGAGGAVAAGVESSPFQQLLQQPMARFDPDAYHVMQERDEQLIEDELLRGVSSKKFVYDFVISGTKVTGVSVVGARQLASEYGGIKARIVATVEKRGALFIFRSFEPLSIETRVLHELSEEVDYYECITQVDDIKTGNSIQVRKKEAKLERKRDGTYFERPHYDVICESKALRNGILSVLPQSVIEAFKQKHLAAGNASNEQTISQRRAGVLTFAAKHGIAINRKALDELTFAELDGLKESLGMGREAFMAAARALQLLTADTGEVPPPAPPAPPAQPPAATQQRQDQPPAAAAQASNPSDPNWTPSPEEEAAIRAAEAAEAAGQQSSTPPASRRAARRATTME